MSKFAIECIIDLFYQLYECYLFGSTQWSFGVTTDVIFTAADADNEFGVGQGSSLLSQRSESVVWITDWY